MVTLHSLWYSKPGRLCRDAGHVRGRVSDIAACRRETMLSSDSFARKPLSSPRFSLDTPRHNVGGGLGVFTLSPQATCVGGILISGGSTPKSVLFVSGTMSSGTSPDNLARTSSIRRCPCPSLASSSWTLLKHWSLLSNASKLSNFREMSEVEGCFANCVATS